MKKKALLIMGLCIMLLAGGCSKKGAAGNLSSSNNSSKKESTSTTDASVTGTPEKGEYNVGDYITLGKYTGIKVTITKLTVSEADLTAAIQKDLQSNAKTEVVKDRTKVKSGDIVNIDYKGTVNGKTFTGGSATKYDLTIGSNTFITGFETGLIGKEVGKTVTLNLKFPSNYSKSNLAGKAVVFKVTINKIKQTVVPTLSESYVKNNTDYDSIAAYKKAKRATLEKEAEQSMQSNISNSVAQKVVKNSKIKSYPKTLITYYSSSYKNYVTQMLYYSYGMSLSDYLKAVNSTEADFNKQVKSVAENYAGLELVERAVAKAENMKVTDSDYKTELKTYMSNYNVSSEADLLKYVTKKQIKDDMLLKKALDFMVDKAIVTKADPTPTPAPTATPAAK